MFGIGTKQKQCTFQQTKTAHYFKCNRCGHEWLPRVERPVECPYCKKLLKYEGVKAEASA